MSKEAENYTMLAEETMLPIEGVMEHGIIVLQNADGTQEEVLADSYEGQVLTIGEQVYEGSEVYLLLRQFAI